MPAPLSIVIPTLDAAAHLEKCFAALTDGLATDLIREVIVSDGGSTDATTRIAEAWGARVLSGPPGRGQQLRRGGNAARSDWLLFLHADTILGPEWVKEVARHLEGPDSRAGYFRLAFTPPSAAARWTAVWANFRSRVFRLPYGDQGLLISRALYDAVGGYPETSLMEDVAIARRLGKRLSALDAIAVTSAAKYEESGFFRRGSRNLFLLLRYLLGADPDRLAESYRRP